jgi:hypothetical protein
MNFFLLLLAMPFLSAAIALWIVLNDHLREGRAHTPRRTEGNAKGDLLRSSAFPLVASVLFLFAVSRGASGQEIVHARAGQLIAVNPTAKTLTLKVADGSTMVFHDVPNPEPAMAFDKDVRSKTVAASSFNTVGAYVVVFYFGFDAPTAVAVEDLGTTALNKTTGSVEGFDRHKHLLTIRNGNAQQREMAVSDATIVDTAEGIVTPGHFHPSRGDELRCFAKPGSQTAYLIASK